MRQSTGSERRASKVCCLASIELISTLPLGWTPMRTSNQPTDKLCCQGVSAIKMSRSPSGRSVTFVDPYLEDEEELGSKDSLNELLLESQPTLDSIEEPGHVGGSRDGRFKLWRKRRRRRSRNPLNSIRTRPHWYQFKCAGFRIIWRLLRALLIFILGIVVTMYVNSLSSDLRIC